MKANALSQLSLLAVSLAATPALAQPALGRYTIADVAERVTPAVVNIMTEKKAQPSHSGFFRHRFGNPGGGKMRGAGSGVVIDPSGVIVTNNHVIDGADEIRVSFADKREFTAKLIGQDKPSDLAFLKIDAKELPYLKLGSSKQLRLGELVLAVGNPFGVGQTVTMGIVSAKGRANMGIVEYEDFIQTDAAINPGNSGGALVNLDGELVGINTAILSRSGGAQGVGFSVPSEMVRSIRGQIEQHGEVRRAWLGVQIQDLTPELADSLGISQRRGVLVSDVLEGGPAEKAGVKGGDVILSVNNQPTEDSAQLKNHVAMAPPDSKARLRVVRDGKERIIGVTLGRRSQGGGVAPHGVGKQPKNELLSGLSLRSISPELRERLELPARVDGVLVDEVAPGSAAARAGLQPGDVITTVNKRPIRAVDQMDARIKPKAARALLRVYRKGGFRFIVLRR